MKDPIYPIGEFARTPFDASKIESLINEIALLPKLLESVVADMTEQDLQQSYKAGGWTFAQLVHHVADSHMNAFVRTKLLVTEENPTIRPYDQDLWAVTADVSNVPINISLTLLYALHARWSELLGSLKEGDWHKCGTHPEHDEPYMLWTLLCLYAWHGRHHAMQIITWKENQIVA